MAKMTILLIGRGNIVAADVAAHINQPDVTILTGFGIDEVRKYLGNGEQHQKVDCVIMGAGIELQKRLDIVAEIFNSSDATTVHLKSVASGVKGFLPFIKAVVTGLKESEV